MINSYAGSFTTDGNHFVFNNFFSTLNKNFDTTDQPEEVVTPTPKCGNWHITSMKKPKVMM